MNNISKQTVKTMSSLELVEVINSMREDGQAELAHSDFLKKVERVLGKDAGKFSSIYQDSMNREKPCYRFPKREAALMVMSESYAVQAKVYDRMTELEAASQANQALSALAPAKEFRALFGIARLIGCDKPSAAISANQAVEKMTGTNLLALMGQTHIPAENQESMFYTPTELGKRVSTSARGMNLLLAEAGLQMKRGDAWEVTEAGKSFARIYDTGKRHGSGVPIQQIKWATAALPMLKKGEVES